MRVLVGATFAGIVAIAVYVLVTAGATFAQLGLILGGL